MSTIYPTTTAGASLPSPALPAPKPPPPRGTDALTGDYFAETDAGDGVPTPDI
jgi:hypothetical protein